MSAKNSKGPKTPIHELANELVEKFRSSGLEIKHGIFHEVIHAALGSVSAEYAKDHCLPFFVHRTEDRQYNLYGAIERARKCLRKMTLDVFQTERIALETIVALQDSGIGLQTVRVMLDPSYHRDVRNYVLWQLGQSIRLNDQDDKLTLTPKTATAAIGSKIIEPKPDTSWTSRFSLAANYPRRGPSNLVEFVNNGDCYLWAFPPADHPATAAASLDKFWDGNNERAELGMGFSIIQAGWTRPVNPLRPGNGTYTQHDLLTPLWDWSRRTNAWRLCNILPSTITVGSPWPRREAAQGLTDLLPQGLQSLPRIHGCHKCRTLFISPAAEHPDIPTYCQCNAPSLVLGKSGLLKAPALNS